MDYHKNTDISRLAVKVTPNAGRSEVTGIKEGVLQIRIGAPPDKGKANRELVDFLSGRLGVGKSAVIILKGHAGRRKIVAVEGMSNEKILERLLPKK